LALYHGAICTVLKGDYTNVCTSRLDGGKDTGNVWYGDESVFLGLRVDLLGCLVGSLGFEYGAGWTKSLGVEV
jgi:hypothetical protein